MNGFSDPDYSDGFDDGWNDRDDGRTYRIKNGASDNYKRGYMAGFTAAAERDQ